MEQNILFGTISVILLLLTISLASAFIIPSVQELITAGNDTVDVILEDYTFTTDDLIRLGQWYSDLGYDESNTTYHFGLDLGSTEEFQESNISGLWYADFTTGYHGPMATYTTKHNPFAIYSSEANSTFFSYGAGNFSLSKGMAKIGIFNHTSQSITVDTVGAYINADAHANPTIIVDSWGYIYVFSYPHNAPIKVARSDNPYDITSFTVVNDAVGTSATYTNSWELSQGLLFLTYRELASKTWDYALSTDNGTTWDTTTWYTNSNTNYRPYTSTIAGNESVGNKSMHMMWTNRNWAADWNTRKNIYYMYSDDGTQTWKNITGGTLTLPIDDNNENQTLVYYTGDYTQQVEDKVNNTNVKDIKLDSNNFPLMLILRTINETNNEFKWEFITWDNNTQTFNVSEIASADHSFDSGEMIVYNDSDIRLYLPTIATQANEDGGDIQEWRSTDYGQTWSVSQNITSESAYSHNYIRTVINSQPDFRAIWGYADSESSPDSYFVQMYYYSDSLGAVVMDGINLNSTNELSYTAEEYSSGKFAEAIEFKGTTLQNYSYGEIPSNFSRNLTISLWFKSKADSTDDAVAQRLASLRGSSSATRLAMGIDTNGGSTNLLGIGYNDGTFTDNYLSDPIQLNTWYHVTMTYNDSTIKLYLNGKEELSVDADIVACSSDVIQFAGMNSRRYFNGSIDDILVYNRTLNSSEVEEVYKKGLANWNYSDWQIVVNGTDNYIFTLSTSTTNLLAEINSSDNNDFNVSYVTSESSESSNNIPLLSTDNKRIPSFWTNTYKEDYIEFVKMMSVDKQMKNAERIQILFDGETHSVGIVDLGTETVTINVSSEVQQATLKKRETAKFEITNDSYYDLKVKVKDINLLSGTINLLINYIHEEIPTVQPNNTIVIEPTGLYGIGNGKIGACVKNLIKDLFYIFMVGLAVFVIWLVCERKKISRF